MSITINTATKHPIEVSEDLTIVPPGSISATDKEGNDLFALRFNTADLTGTLNGAVSVQTTGEYASAILFQDTDDALLDGSLIFSSGKMALSASGTENVCAVYADEVTLSGVEGAPLTGTVKVAAKSAETATAIGIYADSGFLSSLALGITVAADASKGADAEATGFSGTFSAEEINDKFKLTVSAKAGNGAAVAGGFEDDFSCGTLSGSFTFTADASKGTDATAYGFYNIITGIQGIGDKFKITLTAKAGSGAAYAAVSGGIDADGGLLAGTISVNSSASKGTDAEAHGFFDDIDGLDGFSKKLKLTISAKAGSGTATAHAFNAAEFADAGGTLAGTVKVTADAKKGTDAYAYGGQSTLTNLAEVSSKFKLSVTANAGAGTAYAYGLYAISATGGVLAGTITVTADASKGSDAEAFGIYDMVAGLQSTDDKFKMTVIAKTGSGTATAKGLSAIDIAEGLGGTVTVTATSQTGSSKAAGGALIPGETFKTRNGGLLTVTAQSKNSATATGLAGDGGDVELWGTLAVQAKGVDSTASGIDAGSGALTGYIGSTGAVAAVGNTATGASGGNASWFTVNGGLYAGNKGSATGIAKSLRKLVGTGKSAAGLNKNSDQAIRLGDNSTLTVNDGAIIIGDVTLGGISMMEISTGAQLYGDIDMSSSGTLNIYIGGSLNKAATITLNSDNAGIFTKSSGVTLSVSATELTETGSYVLLAGSNLSGLSEDYDTLFEQLDFESYGLQAEWELDLSGKTDTLTLILSQAPVGSTSSLLSATDLNSADRMLASSSLTDVVTTSGANVWKNALIA